MSFLNLTSFIKHFADTGKPPAAPPPAGAAATTNSTTVGGPDADAWSKGMGAARAAEADAFGNGAPEAKFNENGDRISIEYKLPDGTLTGSATFDPETGRMTSKSRYEGRVLTSTESYDPTTGKKTGSTSFDSQGNKVEVYKYDPATGKPISAERYTPDGKLLATATFNEAGAFDEVIYDTDTGEVLTKCSNAGGDPFSNCDPASIARIKESKAEIDALKAKKNDLKEQYDGFKDADGGVPNPDTTAPAVPPADVPPALRDPDAAARIKQEYEGFKDA